MYAPPAEGEASGVELEGVRPSSLRCVGVRGISVISSWGAQSGRREVEAKRTSTRRTALRARVVRLGGIEARDLCVRG
jgi:hypothetical protein